MSSNSRSDFAHRSPSSPGTDDGDSGVTPAVAGIRRYNRVDVDVEVILQDEDGWEYPTKGVDLSPAGIFVASEFLFDEGTQHDIIFRDPDGETLFRLSGEVVRVEDDESEGDRGPSADSDSPAGMAYEFLGATDETRRRLQAAFGGSDNARRV